MTWVDQLPDEMAGQQMLLRGLLSFCEAEESIRWLVIGCSLSRGAGNFLSDLDMAIGVRDDDFETAVPKIQLPVLDLRVGEQPHRQPATHPLPPLTLRDEVPPAGFVPVLGLLRIDRHEATLHRPNSPWIGADFPN